MVPTITAGVINDVNYVTLRLSWGEPFNNFDPIVNYTVSCSGDVTCPPNFTTTNSRIIISKLAPMTNYTFSVVATNSIGCGKASVIIITTPGVGKYSTCMHRCSMRVTNVCKYFIIRRLFNICTTVHTFSCVY